MAPNDRTLAHAIKSRERPAAIGFVPGEQRVGYCLKLELDDLERRAIGASLMERQARLFEIVGDTTRPIASRQAASHELAVVASALRKLGPSDPAQP